MDFAGSALAIIIIIISITIVIFILSRIFTDLHYQIFGNDCCIQRQQENQVGGHIDLKIAQQNGTPVLPSSVKKMENLIRTIRYNHYYAIQVDPSLKKPS